MPIVEQTAHMGICDGCGISLYDSEGYRLHECVESVAEEMSDHGWVLGPSGETYCESCRSDHADARIPVPDAVIEELGKHLTIGAVLRNAHPFTSRRNAFRTMVRSISDDWNTVETEVVARGRGYGLAVGELLTWTLNRIEQGYDATYVFGALEMHVNRPIGVYFEMVKERL